MQARISVKLLRFTPALLSLLVATSCMHIPGFAPIESSSRSEGVVTRTDNGHCLDLLPESSLHRIMGCETELRYTIRAPQHQPMEFAKAEFRQIVTSQIRRSLNGSAYPIEKLPETEVEAWLLAPIFEPEKVQWVLVVTGGGHNFAVHLPLDPKLWPKEHSHPISLGTDHYPSMRAMRTGILVLEASSMTSRQAILNYLRQFNPLQLDARLWPLVEMRMPPFTELDLLRKMQQQPLYRNFVARTAMLPAREAESVRGLAFKFAWPK